ncbi:MAG: hypothetical protein JOZ41_04120 [Chloroflexi bacterium]|nr:hypothetical protein [Chloroflexota bacterium]
MLSLLDRAIRALPPKDVEGLLGELERSAEGKNVSPSNSALVEALARGRFSEDERIALDRISRFQYFQRRRELLQGALTTSQVAQLLGTSRQTPHDRVKSDSLLAIQDRGALRFPAWQFDPEGPNGVVAGLPDVLRSLRVPPLSRVSWLVSPNPVLDGMTPLRALQRGEIERVVQVARGVGVA